jgi:hypothetical protein
MDWITESVAIGNCIDAHDPVLREQHGFLGLISLDGSMTNEKALALGYDDWGGACQATCRLIHAANL